MFSESEARALVKDLRGLVDSSEVPIQARLLLKVFMFDLQGDDLNKQRYLSSLSWLRVCHQRSLESKTDNGQIQEGGGERPDKDSL